MNYGRLDDINFPAIILCDWVDPILKEELTDEEFMLFSLNKRCINNVDSFYMTLDFDNFFLVGLSSEFYSSFKLEMAQNKKKIIHDLIHYRRNCKKISDKVGIIEYKNFFNEDVKMTLFDFSTSFFIPFYDVYFMYLQHGYNSNKIFEKKNDDAAIKNNVELFMKIFDVSYAIKNFSNIMDIYDNILNMKNRGQFIIMSDELLYYYNSLYNSNKDSKNIVLDDYNLKKLFKSFNYYLSLFVLLDEKEIFTKELMTEAEEIYIKNIGNNLLNKSEIYLSDIKEIYNLSKYKYPSKKFNTELIDAIINEKYDFIQNNNSKIIDFKCAIKK